MALLNHIAIGADFGDIMGILLALLVPLLYAIKQIADATKQNKPAPAQPQAAEPRPVEAAAGRPQAGGQQADPLRNQVEEFLRRAGRAPQGQRPRPAGRDIELLVDEEQAARWVSERGGKAATKGAKGAAGATGGAAAPQGQAGRRSVIPRKRKTLAERATEQAVARDTKMAEQTSHLGQRIIADDEQFDVDLKARFDHRLGSLAAPTQPALQRTTIETPASQIAAMLATPEGVRQAIVLNEILTRPSHRW